MDHMMGTTYRAQSGRRMADDGLPGRSLAVLDTDPAAGALAGRDPWLGGSYHIVFATDVLFDRQDRREASIGTGIEERWRAG